MSEKDTSVLVYEAMVNALSALQEHKPNDRSLSDRAWAVTITMMEQAVAYFRVWAMREVSSGKE